jgi:hypothetical protein
LIYKSVSNRAFSIWSLVIALEGLLAAYFIVREPSETDSIVAFGLSSQRLLIVVGVISVAVFFVVVGIAHFYQLISWNESISKKPKLIRYSLTGAITFELVILHLLFLIPEYQFPALYGYLFRLRPVLIWLALVFAQTIIFLAYFGTLPRGVLKEWQGYRPVIITLVIVGVIWGLVAMTGIGIIPEDFYWNMAGVPLLAWQVWAAVIVTLVGWFLYNRFILRKSFSRLSSLVICIGIWVVAAIIWIWTPLAPTFNAPGPYLPSKEFYPFVDAALFDLGAQSAIYGKGFFFGTFFDRGLLMGFLALVHMVFGQNYLVAVGVQSAVYAVFPVLLYLLGEKLHSKPAGLLAATLAILKVSNAIAGGKWISTSHPKLTMTEFPTAIVLVLISLFLVLWLKNYNSKPYYLAGVGAVIGIGILLRTNVFFIFPAVLFFGIIVWKQHWKRAFRDVLLVVVAFFITVSPWMWRNQQVAGEPLFFLRRFDSVIEERYQPQSRLDPIKSASLMPSRALKIGPTKSKTTINDLLDQYQFIPRHFVHNIVTSVLILPPSPVWDDLRHVVEKYPYWDRITNPWQGQISGSLAIFLAVNLIIFSIGIGTAWKRVGFVAIVPLTVFLFYNLANAFARTSGGRYIVPVDWVIYFYYAIGLVEIIRLSISVIGFQTEDFFGGVPANKHDQADRKFNWAKTGLVILPFFLMVATLPVIELTSPGENPPATTEPLMQQLDEVSFFTASGLSRLEVEEFLSNPDTLLISGRGFYPRYYSYGQGEPILPGQITAYTSRDYPRLVFTLLLPDSDKPVVLPFDEPKLNFPDAAEVIVGGCQVGQSTILTSYLNYIDAAFIVILDEPELIYIRVPEAPLDCPLHEPVCDNNHNCK